MTDDTTPRQVWRGAAQETGTIEDSFFGSSLVKSMFGFMMFVGNGLVPFHLPGRRRSRPLQWTLLCRGDLPWSPETAGREAQPYGGGLPPSASYADGCSKWWLTIKTHARSAHTAFGSGVLRKRPTRLGTSSLKPSLSGEAKSSQRLVP